MENNNEFPPEVWQHIGSYFPKLDICIEYKIIGNYVTNRYCVELYYTLSITCGSNTYTHNITQKNALVIYRDYLNITRNWKTVLQCHQNNLANNSQLIIYGNHNMQQYFLDNHLHVIRHGEKSVLPFPKSKIIEILDALKQKCYEEWS